MYNDIMNMDPKIRLVTICNNDGKIMYSDHLEGVKNLLSPEESKESLEMALGSWKIRTKLGPKIEKENMYWQNTKRLNVSLYP